MTLTVTHSCALPHPQQLLLGSHHMSNHSLRLLQSRFPVGTFGVKHCSSCSPDLISRWVCLHQVWLPPTPAHTFSTIPNRLTSSASSTGWHSYMPYLPAILGYEISSLAGCRMWQDVSQCSQKLWTEKSHIFDLCFRVTRVTHGVSGDQNCLLYIWISTIQL